MYKSLNQYGSEEKGAKGKSTDKPDGGCSRNSGNPWSQISNTAPLSIFQRKGDFPREKCLTQYERGRIYGHWNSYWRVMFTESQFISTRTIAPLMLWYSYLIWHVLGISSHVICSKSLLHSVFSWVRPATETHTNTSFTSSTAHHTRPPTQCMNMSIANTHHLHLLQTPLNVFAVPVSNIQH